MHIQAQPHTRDIQRDTQAKVEAETQDQTQIHKTPAYQGNLVVSTWSLQISDVPPPLSVKSADRGRRAGGGREEQQKGTDTYPTPQTALHFTVIGSTNRPHNKLVVKGWGKSGGLLIERAEYLDCEIYCARAYGLAE